MRYAKPAYVALALFAVLLLVALGTPLAAADEKTSATPAASNASAAPYVDSKIAKQRFAEITAQDMDLLRTKKILFASRSFGQNLCTGLRLLAKQDAKYEFLSSYQKYDVFAAGGNLDIIPSTAFKDKNFVHFFATYWPHTKRMEEMDQLLRQKPHEFGQVADVVIVFFHTALPQHFEQYAAMMDAWRRDFPKIKFIYVTAGFMGPAHAKDNEAAHEWSEKVRQRYQGQVPLYDLGKILSDDFRAGHVYCPEYSADPADVHPNLAAGEEMMAKGFLLLLRDTFRWHPTAAPVLPEIKLKPAAAAKVETLPATHPDYQAVRAILDANGLKDKKVEGVAVVEKGRVVKLFLQEGGLRELPDALGTLTELRVLHVYGDRKLPHPFLEKISPAIGRCTKLEELLLNHNDLTTLPAEIAALTKLKSLSLADNRLKDLPPPVADWAKRFDPKGLAQQKP